jgi:hypothetical protein
MTKAIFLLAAAAASLTACERETASEATPSPGETNGLSEETGAALRPGPRWESVASGEGYALRLTGRDGQVLLSFSCIAEGRRLVVNVPAFEPVGGEDRLTIGIGGEPLALAADPGRQLPGTGVTAEAPIPEELRTLVARARQVSAVYGDRQEGPHAPPAASLAEEFVAACEEIAAS